MAKTVRKKYPRKFYFLMGILPIVFLGVLEIVLRFSVDDPTTPLVVVSKDGGGRYYQLNPRVGERFFTGGVAAIPEVYPQRFSVVKSPNTVRIFCLGGSTMASFPYELNARVSSLLQDRLQSMFPEKNVEVINAGMAAVNSYAVCEFIRELVTYQPDLFVMYMGHNEFYGALGVGSTQSLGQHRWLIRLNLGMQKYRTFQVLRRLTVATFAAFREKPQGTAEKQTLMEGMARDKTIALSSATFRCGVAQFESNLKDILAVARKHRVPMLVGTLVSNLRDMAPFASGFAVENPPEIKQKWQQLFDTGLRLQRHDSLAAALNFYARAAAIDSGAAILHYRIGEIRLARNDTAGALAAFVRARDHDLLRFRAPSLFNIILRDECASFQVPVVDIEQAFARESPFGIVGHEFISEHLHPNFDGYFLMAKSFCDGIVENGLLTPDRRIGEAHTHDDPYFREISAVTEFDLEIGAAKIRNLTGHWPFRMDQFAFRPDTTFGSDFVRKTVAVYQSGKIGWNTGHFQMAEYYAQQQQIEQAVREYRAVAKVLPDNDLAYARIADILIRQQKYDDAEQTLNEALTIQEGSPFLHAKLGLVGFLKHDYVTAVDQFRMALEIDHQKHVLPKNDRVTASYYAALAEIQLGFREKAIPLLTEVIQMMPAHPEAGKLLDLLKRGVAVKLQF